MTHTAVTVGRYAPFKGIVTLRRDRQAGALPVLEGEGRVVGVASEADLRLEEGFRDSDPDRLAPPTRCRTTGDDVLLAVPYGRPAGRDALPPGPRYGTMPVPSAAFSASAPTATTSRRGPPSTTLRAPVSAAREKTS